MVSLACGVGGGKSLGELKKWHTTRGWGEMTWLLSVGYRRGVGKNREEEVGGE